VKIIKKHFRELKSCLRFVTDVELSKLLQWILHMAYIDDVSGLDTDLNQSYHNLSPRNAF